MDTQMDTMWAAPTLLRQQARWQAGHLFKRNLSQLSSHASILRWTLIKMNDADILVYYYPCISFLDSMSLVISIMDPGKARKMRAAGCEG